MISILVVLTLLPLQPFAAPAASPRQATYCDVAVIGGGSAGANTAVFLKDKGYSVCLFEQTSRLGGHCNTFTFSDAPPDEPNWVDIGVQFYPNTSYFNSIGEHWSLLTDQYMARFMPYGEASLSPIDFASSLPITPVDLQDGGASVNLTYTLEQQAAALETYIGILSQYPWLEQPGVIPDPIPPELLVPFDQFIATNGLEALGDSFFRSFVAFDFGPFNKLVTLAALQAARPAVVIALSPSPSFMAPVGGCGTFYAGIQSYLGDSVYLNANVVRVQRRGTGKRAVTLQVELPSGKQHFYAGHLFIASPQTLSNLAFLDLDFIERSLFATVSTRQLFAIEFNVAGNLATDEVFSLGNFDPTQEYLFPAPPLLIQVYRYLPYGPAAGLALAEAPISDAEMLGIVNTSLAAIPSSLLSEAQVTEFIRHVYDPHFPVEALRQSPTPYTRLNRLQGHRNTYYVGSLLVWPESVPIWEYAYQLVNQNF